jgi:isocitrate dehydrogenase
VSKENHLRWDSLGEFLALAASLEFLAGKATTRGGARQALDRPPGKLLENGKSPSRKVGELDNRGSHFYLTLYWAQALAEQTDDEKVQQAFAPLAERLAADEDSIVAELNDVQGEPVELGGYYWVDREKATAAMRPKRHVQRRDRVALGRESSAPHASPRRG